MQLFDVANKKLDECAEKFNSEQIAVTFNQDAGQISERYVRRLQIINGVFKNVAPIFCLIRTPRGLKVLVFVEQTTLQ